MRYISAPLMLTGCALAFSAAAEPVDGSKPLLCATIDTIECVAQADCQYGTSDSLGFPQFLEIDTQGKRITADRPDGTRLDTTITTVSEFDDRLVFQGVENSMGWSVSINRANGRMTVAIAGKQIAFMVFGACTAR